ncbi:MAG: peptidase M20, partial [Gammaproteobacteria bacterium]
MDQKQIQNFINQSWDKSILPAIQDYIRIPNKSVAFDRDWQKHGYMERAVQLAADWCRRNAAAGMRLEILRSDGRTPLIFIEIPGTSDD